MEPCTLTTSTFGKHHKLLQESIQLATVKLHIKVCFVRGLFTTIRVRVLLIEVLIVDPAFNAVMTEETYEASKVV